MIVDCLGQIRANRNTAYVEYSTLTQAVAIARNNVSVIFLTKGRLGLVTVIHHFIHIIERIFP